MKLSSTPEQGRAPEDGPRLIVQAVKLIVFGCVGALALWLVSTQSVSLQRRLAARGRGPVEVERHSDYSHIRIRKQGTVRTLLFVDGSGRETVESSVDVAAPQRLLLPYSRAMFANYLVQSRPERRLIIGLGGGAMCHFLRHYAKGHTDVVEIDPVVVTLARDYFALVEDDQLAVHIADGFAYLQSGSQRYDVIYMDAFLRPSSETDRSGIPLKLKTLRFYRQLRERLEPEGVVVFNLHQRPGVAEDLATIEEAFGECYQFSVPSGNLVVLATQSTQRLGAEELLERARELDAQWQLSDFEQSLTWLRPR